MIDQIQAMLSGKSPEEQFLRENCWHLEPIDEGGNAGKLVVETGVRVSNSDALRFVNLEQPKMRIQISGLGPANVLAERLSVCGRKCPFFNNGCKPTPTKALNYNLLTSINLTTGVFEKTETQYEGEIVPLIDMQTVHAVRKELARKARK